MSAKTTGGKTIGSSSGLGQLLVQVSNIDKFSPAMWRLRDSMAWFQISTALWLVKQYMHHEGWNKAVWCSSLTMRQFARNPRAHHFEENKVFPGIESKETESSATTKSVCNMNLWRILILVLWGKKFQSVGPYKIDLLGQEVQWSFGHKFFSSKC